MAQKTVWLPEIGELTLSKRRGTRHLRLSISASGRLRVGLPTWLPYSAGISFALARRDWLLKHKPRHQASQLSNGDRIGKSYRLRFEHDPTANRLSTRRSANTIFVKSPNPIETEAVQVKVRAAAERALKAEAQHLLPVRLNQLADRHGFKFHSHRIRKMTSRWGSCSSHKVITLNFFLMQLPWPLIDYVLLHELIHTRHLNHSPVFWREFERVYPGAKQAQRQIRQYRPVINSVTADMA